MYVEFIVRLTLDPEGDGTVPTEDDLAGAVAALGETYPISLVEVADAGVAGDESTDESE